MSDEDLRAIYLTQTVAPSERIVLMPADLVDAFVKALDRSVVFRVSVFIPESVVRDGGQA